MLAPRPDEGWARATARDVRAMTDPWSHLAIGSLADPGQQARKVRPLTCIGSISGLVAEYIVAIDVTRVRFPADAKAWWPQVKARGGARVTARDASAMTDPWFHLAIGDREGLEKGRICSSAHAHQ